MEPNSDGRPRTRLASAVLVLGLSLPVFYVLSSGPVVAAAFWLREQTGRNEFYSVGFLYYPLLRFGGELVNDYVGWWVELFGTVGPG